MASRDESKTEFLLVLAARWADFDPQAAIAFDFKDGWRNDQRNIRELPIEKCFHGIRDSAWLDR